MQFRASSLHAVALLKITVCVRMQGVLVLLPTLWVMLLLLFLKQ